MGKAIGYATGIKPNKGNENRSKKAEGRNRRERKTEGRNENERIPSSKAAKEIYKKRETDHERTWDENER